MRTMTESAPQDRPGMNPPGSVHKAPFTGLGTGVSAVRDSRRIEQIVRTFAQFADHRLGDAAPFQPH
jgi:hypothetical protein